MWKMVCLDWMLLSWNVSVQRNFPQVLYTAHDNALSPTHCLFYSIYMSRSVHWTNVFFINFDDALQMGSHCACSVLFVCEASAQVLCFLSGSEQWKEPAFYFFECYVHVYQHRNRPSVFVLVFLQDVIYWKHNLSMTINGQQSLHANNTW